MAESYSRCIVFQLFLTYKKSSFVLFSQIRRKQGHFWMEVYVCHFTDVLPMLRTELGAVVGP